MKNYFFKFVSKIKKHKKAPDIAIYILVLSYFILFSYLSIAEHLGLKSNMNDLGNMDQALYTTTKGKFMVNSTFFIAEGKTNPSFIAKHAFFTLLAFIPFYLIYPSPNMLLIAQSALVALGALPLYWLGREFFKKERWLSLITPFAYLVNPTVHDATLHDFHALTIAMPIVIFAFYFMYKKRYFWFYLLAVIIALSKEDMPLTIFMFGLYMFFIQKERLRGFIVSLFSILYFFVVVDIIMPYFSGTESLPLISSRYSHLGGNAFEIVKTLIVKPWLIISYSLSELKFAYILSLFIPVLFIPFLSLEVLSLLVPGLLVNLLSSNSIMHQPFEFYHSAVIMAIIFIATTFSINKLKVSKLNRISSKVVGVSLVISLLLSPTPFSLVSSWEEFKVTEHAARISEVKHKIPDDASVSAQNNLGPHLSQRIQIYNFPYGHDFADFIALDINDPNPIARFSPRGRIYLININMVYPQIYYDTVLAVFNDEAYGVVYYSDDGYLVFERGASRDANADALVMFDKNIRKIFERYGMFKLEYSQDAIFKSAD